MRRLSLVMAAALACAAPAPRADVWRILGPGGGGSLFHPAVSPHDSRTVLVACDMTGSYITHDGGATWRIFNLGGPVRFFLFDPIDARVIYAKGPGIFRSADNGETWKRFFPRDVQKITMGDDHAEGRLHTDAQLSGEVSAMAIDPADSRAIYLALGTALWTSTDTGATWQKAADFHVRTLQIWIDPRSPPTDRTLYLASADILHIRREGGWSSEPFPVPATAIAGAPPVFYLTHAGKIHVSTDGGVTWRDSELPGFQGQATEIAASAEHPEVAYVSYSGLRAPMRATWGVAKTTDSGRHWEPVYDSVRDAWLTDRFGAGGAGNPYSLGVAPHDAGTVYATDSGRVIRTTDGGKTWNSAYSNRTPDGNWITNGVDVTTCYGVHFDPFEARHMFISYTDIGLWASDTGGASWYSATRRGVPRQWENTTYWMEFDPTVRGRIWAAMSGTHDLPRPKMWRRASPASYTGGVVRSDDGGRTWRVQNSGMPQTAATHILRDPAGALYVTGFGRGVFKSTDGGEHWSLKNAGIAGEQPFAWRMVRDSKDTLYLTVARRSDDGTFGNAGDGALYRSTDGAEHWSRVPLPAGLNGPNGLAIDPQNPGRLYLAAWGRSTPEGAADGGIYLSTNRGASWLRVFEQDQHIYDVTIDPADARVLYATGFESAAWRSADRGLTWKRIPGFDFKWAHRVTVDPQDRGQIYITTFGGSVWHGTGAMCIATTPGYGCTTGRGVEPDVLRHVG
ncbi:MAG: hypothetical protein NTW28_13780 [Candidatus Solibacter sp.]|nr:hypothetical protein [Candidatus Solibacter sp.]